MVVFVVDGVVVRSGSRHSGPWRAYVGPDSDRQFNVLRQSVGQPPIPV